MKRLFIFLYPLFAVLFGFAVSQAAPILAISKNPSDFIAPVSKFIKRSYGFINYCRIKSSPENIPK